MIELSIDRVNQILNNAENQKVVVIGDLMLDKFYWGNVSRISPEAPVPVVELEKETYHLGGAANVATNLKSLNLQPIMIGVIGKDQTGEEFLNYAKKIGLITDGVFSDSIRPTTVKTRIIANTQHVARLDKEVVSDIDQNIQNYFIEYLQSLDNIKAIILEDYNKGMLPKEFIKKIIDFALSRNIFISVDPKQQNFFEFKNADLFKPNKKEASKALNFNINSKESVREAGLKLIDRLQCKNLLLTLGSDGMILFQSNGDIYSVPTRARQVADVSGAGDTAIATYTAAHIGGANPVESASLANFASGAVCEKSGVVPIEINDLISSIKRNGLLKSI